MKPFRIFIFFISVLLLLAVIAFLMPEHGIGINGDFRFRFVTIHELLQEKDGSQDEMVERLLAVSSVSEDPEADPLGMKQEPSDALSGPRPAGADLREHDSSMLVEPDPQANRDDPLQADRSGPASGSPFPGVADDLEEEFATRAANPDSLQKVLHRLQFAAGNEAMLFPFFRKLDQLKTGGSQRTRILHFGDSQIENDRMTALIRYRMQKDFGGTGTGLVQAVPLYSGSLSYQQEEEGSWRRYTFFRNRDTTISHNDFGIMAAFTAVPPSGDEGWPMLHYQFNLARRSGLCDRVKIFLNSVSDGAALVFQVNDTIIDTLRNIGMGYNMLEFRHVGIIRDLKLYLGFPQGGRIYGISFESFSGLQMDNIAMRGSSGLIFTQMDRTQQEQMMEQLSPGLIVLQYGGNVVPYMNPRYYRRAFEEELAFLKGITPGVPIIVIGPADMSVREKGAFQTHPGLERVRDALRTATLESGYAFWDLYEAMGGYNSMPSFVHADPPLASTDYVHFNNLGINLIAEMFYNALMMEYVEYENQYSTP